MPGRVLATRPTPACYDIALHHRWRSSRSNPALPDRFPDSTALHLMKNYQKGFISRITIGIVLGICLVLAFAVTLLPKGFKDDLTLIGKGTASVVLVHDKHLVESAGMMELLNKVRADYEPRVLFLAVDIATPVGQRFTRDQNAGPLDLIAFGPAGEKVTVVSGGTNEQGLRSILDGI